MSNEEAYVGAEQFRSTGRTNHVRLHGPESPARVTMNSSSGTTASKIKLSSSVTDSKEELPASRKPPKTVTINPVVSEEKGPYSEDSHRTHKKHSGKSNKTIGSVLPTPMSPTTHKEGKLAISDQLSGAKTSSPSTTPLTETSEESEVGEEHHKVRMTSSKAMGSKTSVEKGTSTKLSSQKDASKIVQSPITKKAAAISQKKTASSEQKDKKPLPKATSIRPGMAKNIAAHFKEEPHTGRGAVMTSGQKRESDEEAPEKKTNVIPAAADPLSLSESSLRKELPMGESQSVSKSAPLSCEGSNKMPETSTVEENGSGKNYSQISFDKSVQSFESNEKTSTIGADGPSKPSKDKRVTANESRPKSKPMNSRPQKEGEGRANVKPVGAQGVIKNPEALKYQEAKRSKTSSEERGAVKLTPQASEKIKSPERLSDDEVDTKPSMKEKPASEDCLAPSVTLNPAVSPQTGLPVNTGKVASEFSTGDRLADILKAVELEPKISGTIKNTGFDASQSDPPTESPTAPKNTSPTTQKKQESSTSQSGKDSEKEDLSRKRTGKDLSQTISKKPKFSETSSSEIQNVPTEVYSVVICSVPKRAAEHDVREILENQGLSDISKIYKKDNLWFVDFLSEQSFHEAGKHHENIKILGFRVFLLLVGNSTLSNAAIESAVRASAALEENGFDFFSLSPLTRMYNVIRDGPPLRGEEAVNCQAKKGFIKKLYPEKLYRAIISSVPINVSKKQILEKLNSQNFTSITEIFMTKPSQASTKEVMTLSVTFTSKKVKEAIKEGRLFEIGGREVRVRMLKEIDPHEDPSEVSSGV